MPAVVVALAFALGASEALAAKKIALVIGNDAYTEVTPLERAVADARAYKDLLENRRGFEVIYAENADRSAMNTKIGLFLSQIRPGDTAIVIYSGHGVQLDPQRRDSLYLLPIDFPNRDPGKGAEQHYFDSESINFARLSDNVANRGAQLRVYVLDACRNNPFKGAGTSRSIGMSRGIGRIQSSSGEFVIYAAAPGEVAFDRLPDDRGEGNSVFTRSFIKHFKSGAYLEDVANDVQEEVVALTKQVNYSQEPYYSDGVAGRTCLDDACGQPAANDATAQEDEQQRAEREKLYWTYCETKNVPAYCKAYLESFPNGWRAPLARARLAELMSRRNGTASGATDGSASPVTNGQTPATRDDAPVATGGSPSAGTTPPTAGGSADDPEVAAVDPENGNSMSREIFRPDRRQVRNIQARLTILGYKPGPVDGLMGRRTRRAITAYQRASSLQPDGELTLALYHQLERQIPPPQLEEFYHALEASARARQAARERAARAAEERAARSGGARSSDADRAAAEREAAARAEREAAERAERGGLEGAETGVIDPSEREAAERRAREARERALAERAAREAATRSEPKPAPERPWICTADPNRAKFDPACRD